MAAGIYNIEIEQGADFQLYFTWKDAAKEPIPITGYSASMQIRQTKESTGTIASFNSPTEITLGGVAGTVSVDMAAADTSLLNFKNAFYDLELTAPSGKVTRVLEGSVSLSKQVTR